MIQYLFLGISWLRTLAPKLPRNLILDVHAVIKEPKLEDFYRILEDHWATYQISAQDGYEVFPVTSATFDLDDEEVGLDTEESSPAESPGPSDGVVADTPSSFVPHDVDSEAGRAAVKARVDALKPLISKTSHKISNIKRFRNHIRHHSPKNT